MSDTDLVTKAKPKSIQEPQAYLTRSIFRFHEPTGFSPDQWRLIAREPINRSAQRFIIRELCALDYTITSDKRNDRRVDDYLDRWDDIWENGDGFDVFLSRMLEDVGTLPFGAGCEVGYSGEDLAWCLHVDAATLLPTYEKAAPYVQVNPDNQTQRIYFRRGQLRRLRVNPRSDIRFKEYQRAPTEDAFMEIEALSKIYLYYMQELTDTPPHGILAVAGWDVDKASAWAKNFREMIEGTDPIKIPVLYDYQGEAQFIPFGRSPQDMNVVEQFKRFAEILLSKYGLSIGDLRLFEHDSTKAGERVSQMVTERSGVGYWASLVATFITRLLPSGLKFEYKQPRPEREKVVAERKMTQAAMLQAATGNKALISVKDAIEEARALELFVTEVVPLDEEDQPPPPLNGGPPVPPEFNPTEEEIDQDADADLSKALLDVGPDVEKALGAAWRHPVAPASVRMDALLRRAFDDAARTVDAEQVEGIADYIKETLEPLEEAEAKAETESESETGELENVWETGQVEPD